MFLIYIEIILVVLFISFKIIFTEIEVFPVNIPERILAAFYLFTLVIGFALKTVAHKDDKSNWKI